jgi:lipoprotein-releasing system permease protein
LAAEFESRFQYKHVSWQESSEDLINTLAIRNRIMYTVVSAVLLVAAFGIYNVISTVVIEKYRAIAILKSIGFYPREIRTIFLAQGIVLGCVGSAIGLPLGMLFMRLLSTIRFKPPGGSQVINMPIDWGWQQFLVAAAFALCAAVLAAYLPARKAGSVKPVDILRGGMG